jgi:predicted nucleotidyltransferase component of viral defense system
LKRPDQSIASIKQRLLNISHERKEDFQHILTRYALERFLFRLSHSRFSDQFILKGAMLFLVWKETMHRPTRDMDLLAYGDSSPGAIKSAIHEICETPVEPDGLVFESESLSLFDIRDEKVYGGHRMSLMARLDKARIPLQIDIGFGDVITPSPQHRTFPSLLAMEKPLIRMYPPETVIAEKLEAMVDLGLQNSRMKDFFDIHFLLRHVDFDGAVLVQAVKATFNRRKTPIPTRPPMALTREFFDDPQKLIQWKAFVNKNRLSAQTLELPQVITEIGAFLEPVLRAVAGDVAFDATWKARGPWSMGGGRNLL